MKAWHGGYKEHTPKAKEQGKEEAGKPATARKLCTQMEAGRYM